VKPLWAIADALQSGKLIAAAMPAAPKEEKKLRPSVLLLGDMVLCVIRFGALGGVDDNLVGLREMRGAVRLDVCA